MSSRYPNYPNSTKSPVDRPSVVTDVKSAPTTGPPRDRERSRRERSRSRSRSRSRDRRRRDGGETSRRRRRRGESGDSRTPSPKRTNNNNAGTPKTQAPAPPTHMTIGKYDSYDKAPEDRLQLGQVATPEFDATAPVVRGNFCIENVNYSTYEAHRKEKPHYAEKFIDALKDDIISEVGNGVRKDDVVLRVSPGAVKTVVLQYDEGTPQEIQSGEWVPEDPKLVNAEWDITVDYAIRARTTNRQQRVAAAMYQALSCNEGLSTYKTKHAYVKWLDPVYGDPYRLVIRKPTVDYNASSKSQAFSMSGTNGVVVAPPATRAVSPVRNVPSDGMYPEGVPPVPKSRTLLDLHHAQQSPVSPMRVDNMSMQPAVSPVGSIYNPHPSTPDADRFRAKQLEEMAAGSPYHPSPVHYANSKVSPAKYDVGAAASSPFTYPRK
eukprot:TRINITY_DN2559_c6_g1_i1.p1 TRINITY_DN2559_c6_g1~~TRINITY_DN2559_c6_g1_i1.p1  ORF type:complete len:448 (+),score=52.98 TRINITY_DN2559_c6_g1_i1:42-1346(+)